MFLQTSKLEIHRVVHMIVGVVASLVTLTNARHWYNLVWLKSVIWTKCRGFWKLQIIIQSCKFTNHRVVPMILWVVASMVTLTNARHWYNLVWLKSVIWTKCRGFWKLQIIIQSCKFTNHRVVPMILWVVASMVKLTNTRHVYNLEWLAKCGLAKTERFVFGVQIWKSVGSAYGWMGSATLHVTAPNCQVHKNGTTKLTRKCRFSKFWFTHQQENQENH